MTQRRLVIVGTSTLAIACLVAMVLLRDDSPATQPASTSTTTALALRRVEPKGPGPSSERAGMPAGFDRSDEGARAAAIAFATASQRWMYFDDAAVSVAVGSMATVAAAPRLVAEVGDEVRVAREGLTGSTGPVWWIVRPLASRLVSSRSDRARVAVWVVSVLSASDAAMPQSDWRTVTLELAWERGDWRVDGIQDSAGPTPMLGPRDRPWAPEQLDEALEGFERVDGGQP